jgi:hypothetical protein
MSSLLLSDKKTCRFNIHLENLTCDEHLKNLEKLKKKEAKLEKETKELKRNE